MPAITLPVRDQIANYPPAAGDALVKLANEVTATATATPIAQWVKSAADGTAATATSETVVGIVNAAGTIGAVKFAPAAALTGDPTNNAVITLQKRTAGGAATTIASLTTTASWTQWSPVTITISAGAVAAGDALTVNITKGGTGVVVPAGVLDVFLT